MSVASMEQTSRDGEPPSRPVVTIAIPTFNRADWLDGAIESALGQSFDAIEVLVCDNCSDDGTESVVRSKRDNRVRMVRHDKNIGLVGNWNSCISNARGEYLVIVPDDDKISSSFVEDAVALFEVEPGIDVVVGLCDYEFISPYNRTYWLAKPGKNATGIWDGRAILKEFFEDHIQAQMCTVMLRTDTLRRTGGFNPHFRGAIDVATWCPLLLEGRIGYINKQCGTFRIHVGSHTASMQTVEAITNNVNFIAHITSLYQQKGRNGSDTALMRAARHYLGRRVLETIVAYRRSGASMRAVAPYLWQWKGELIRARVPGSMRLIHMLSFLLLPQFVIEGFRKIKHWRRQTTLPDWSAPVRGED